jgi:hypothetical protein
VVHWVGGPPGRLTPATIRTKDLYFRVWGYNPFLAISQHPRVVGSPDLVCMLGDLNPT